MSMDSEIISTYIINLKKRIDRKENILKEFSGREEYTFQIVDAFEHPIGAFGLWTTIKYILRNLVDCEKDFIIICEDDHQFTKFYSKERLFKAIASAKNKNADILLGGVSWVGQCIEADESIFWIKKFTGLQFTVIFKKFIEVILTASFTEKEDADFKISSLTDKKYLMYPFISNQKEFGYSDITFSNNKDGHVTNLFDRSLANLNRLKKIRLFYDSIKFKDLTVNININNTSIHTFIINFSKEIETVNLINQQFAHRPEFNTKVVAAKKDGDICNMLPYVRKITQQSIDNRDDLIIICTEQHRFTEHYKKEVLFEKILKTYQEGGTILLGGLEDFVDTVQIEENRFWISSFKNSSFIVLFKELFKQIIDFPSDVDVPIDKFLSLISTNKTVLFPFVATQVKSEIAHPSKKYESPIQLSVSDRLNEIRNFKFDT